MRVLVADDHEMVREGVKAALRFEEGVEIVGEARDGIEALRLAHALKPDAIVIDNWMPELSGLEVARRMRTDLPEIAVVMLTLDADARRLALASGVTTVVLKDAPSGELVRAVRGIAGKPKRRSPGRRERDRLYTASVLALSGAIEAKETGGRSGTPRLAGVARRLAEHVGRGEVEAERIELAALLRDIGKVAIPDAILGKAGPLEPSERRAVRAHVTRGTEILAASPALADVVPLVRHHHERYDGSGYPDRLRADEIPVGAQIVGLVDTFNAIVSPRAYKAPLSAEFAFEQLRLGAGRQFGLSLVTAFLDLYSADPAALLGPRIPPESATPG